MSTLFLILTVLFIVVSGAMILIILVQRAQGGGLAGAFGGAGGSGTDTVFGGRVGDALTWATVIAFVLYLLIAIFLNRVSVTGSASAAGPPGTTVTTPGDGDGTAPGAPGDDGSTTGTPDGGEAPVEGGVFDPSDLGDEGGGGSP